MIVICTMTEEVYNDIPHKNRKEFKSINFKEKDEWDTHKDDKVYLRLRKRQSKAKKELEKYLFDKRHN